MKKTSGVFDLIQPGFKGATVRHPTLQPSDPPAETPLLPCALLALALGAGIGLAAGLFL